MKLQITKIVGLSKKYLKQHREARKDIIQQLRSFFEEYPEMIDKLESIDERFYWKLTNFPTDLTFLRIATTMSKLLEA